MKKILSVVLVVFLLSGCLIGCGTKEPQISDESQTSQEEKINPVSATKTAVCSDWGEYYVYSIIGKATNNTDDYISRVVITITVYDDVDVAMKKNKH